MNTFSETAADIGYLSVAVERGEVSDGINQQHFSARVPCLVVIGKPYYRLFDLLCDPEQFFLVNFVGSKLGGVLQEALADDDKIEEARMQLLNDPTVAGNKALSEMFSTDEMMEILNDPVKWKKTVKEGQRMLTGQGNDGKMGGVGMGEL